MKKIMIISLIFLTIMISGCQKKEDDFTYDVKLFHQYTEFYDDVIYREFIYLHGVNIIDTYEAYLEIVYLPHYIEHTLTYNEAFFEENTLILFNVYDERANSFNVDVTHSNGHINVALEQVNGFIRFSSRALLYIWTVAVEVNTKIIHSVDYQISETNDYYDFYTYWLEGLAHDLKGTHVFNDYASWQTYVEQINILNEANIENDENSKMYDVSSLHTIIGDKTFDDKTVVLHLAETTFGETHYLPLDVYRLYDPSYDSDIMYFKLFKRNGYPTIGLDSTGHAISLFIIDKQSVSFTPNIQLIDNIYELEA